MRLLNTTTLSLHEFTGNKTPRYAILSHRWESEEVTFQSLQSISGVCLAGYSKITSCCAQAASDGWEWVWIDSCCIDKTSSAELSEAINSMFRWYREAEVCYAYLSDVPIGGDRESLQKPDSAFRNSQWFTRGWTLQELLAPETVVFFDAGWTDIGTKNSMEDLLSSITGVTSFADFESACIAQKMSWAAKRQTTRKEDQAYCLMGLFGVNMPPLYGEGNGAFLRLQLQIIQSSTDESIFAWANPGAPDHTEEGLLATSPLFFSHCKHVERGVPFDTARPEFAMTSRGLRILLYLMPEGPHPDLFLAPLNCIDRCSNGLSERPLAVLLRRVYRDQFVRRSSRLIPDVHANKNGAIHDGKPTLVYVQQRSDAPVDPIGSITFVFAPNNLMEHGFQMPGTVIVAEPSYSSFNGINPMALTLTNERKLANLVYLCFAMEKTQESFILLLCIFDFKPRATLAVPDSSLNWEHSVENAVLACENCPRLDRTSKLLSSGKSVSVALRSKSTPSGQRTCIVDINIDSSGKLRWS